MIFKLTAAAVVVATFTPADEPHLSAGLGIEDGEEISIHLDEDGSVIDIEGAECADDRQLTQLCETIAEYFAASDLGQSARRRHAIPYATMLEYIEGRYPSALEA